MSAKRTRHQPQRRCVACREGRDKRALVRLVRTPEGAIRIDDSGRLPGRGAYVCRRLECWQRALGASAKASKQGAGAPLARALRATIDHDARAALEAEAGDRFPAGEADASEAPVPAAGAPEAPGRGTPEGGTA